jgi:hypothetical protein
MQPACYITNGKDHLSDPLANGPGAQSNERGQKIKRARLQATDPVADSGALSRLVKRLIAEADADEALIDRLAAAIKQGNRANVFLLAAQLTGIAPENGTTASPRQFKPQDQP